MSQPRRWRDEPAARVPHEEEDEARSEKTEAGRGESFFYETRAFVLIVFSRLDRAANRIAPRKRNREPTMIELSTRAEWLHRHVPNGDFAGILAAIFPTLWIGLFTGDAEVTAVGEAYLRRVGLAYPFFGLGLALYFVAQGRGSVVPPLISGTTRLLVAGLGGIVAVQSFGAGLDELFTLMPLGLVLYGTVMMIVMRRELGLMTPKFTGVERGIGI